jgi:hypothetical protein
MYARVRPLSQGSASRALADSLFEEQQVVDHVLQQATVATGVAGLEVQPQFDAATAAVQPQLEMDEGTIRAPRVSWPAPLPDDAGAGWRSQQPPRRRPQSGRQ